MDTTAATAPVALAAERSLMGFDEHVGIFVLASIVSYLVVVLFFGFLHLSAAGVGFMALCFALTTSIIVFAVDVLRD